MPDLIHYAFVWEKGKTMEFSETIVDCDIKDGIYSLYVFQRSRSFFDLGARSLDSTF